MSEVIESELQAVPGHEHCRVAALSGPTHAEEVARDMPTLIVAAARDEADAQTVQKIFTNPNFRVYTNTDRRGVELGGAVKNVIALAVGMALGLDYGDNAKAALITRGNAELARLGVAMGCQASTFAGCPAWATSSSPAPACTAATCMRACSWAAASARRGQKRGRPGCRRHQRAARRPQARPPVPGGNAHRRSRARHRLGHAVRAQRRRRAHGPRPQAGISPAPGSLTRPAAAGHFCCLWHGCAGRACLFAAARYNRGCVLHAKLEKQRGRET